MKRIFAHGLTMVSGFALAAVFVAGVSANTGHSSSIPAAMHADAAFRDGYYIGQRDASQGRDIHVAVGRWSAEKDRAAYRSGYAEGFATKAALK